MSANLLDQSFLLQEKDQEIARLKEELEFLKRKNNHECPNGSSAAPAGTTDQENVKPVHFSILNKALVGRYSRQLILHQIGAKGQLALCNASVLVVGAGGLGCPASLYLAAAGVGHIGIVDYDAVELSNLHRQVLHKEAKIGTPKVASAAAALREFTSLVKVTPHHLELNSSNAMSVIGSYDIVLDCSDNPATRYLLNDACVLANKPLVSGSALRWEAQLTVYNYGGSPCYRCMYPHPPESGFVTNCAEGGVIGPVVGMMGTLQALEAVKIILGMPPAYAGKLLLFDGEDGTFRTVKLRNKRKDCCICGEEPTITELIDYVKFCGHGPNDKDEPVKLLGPEERITPEEYHEALHSRPESLLLIDVRPAEQLELCALPVPKHFVNIPITKVENELPSVVSLVETFGSGALEIVVVCRRGNDSQIATRMLKKDLRLANVSIRDIKGGLHAWAEKIDHAFPVY